MTPYRLPRALLLSLLALLLPNAARATASETVDGTRLLTDPAALTRWVEDHHPRVQAARAEVEAAQAELDDAGILLPNPEFDITAENMAVGRKVRTDVGFTAVYDMGLSQTVEIGKRGPRREAARQRLEAARQKLLATVSEVVTEAREALALVAFQESRQRILEETLSLTRRSIGLEERRYELGDISGTDLNRLRLEAIHLEAEVSIGEADLRGAHANCAALLQATCVFGEIAVLGDLLPAQLPVSPIEDVPTLRALLHDQKAEENEATLASREAIPDPTFRFGYVSDRFSLSNDDPYTLGVGVSIPLPIFDRGQHRAGAARARARAIAREADSLRNTLTAEVASLVGRYGRLTSTVTTLRDEALPRSEAVLESISAAFRQGEIGMTDLLLARQGHTGLQLRLLDLQLERFTTANQLRRLLALDLPNQPKDDR